MQSGVRRPPAALQKRYEEAFRQEVKKRLRTASHMKLAQAGERAGALAVYRSLKDGDAVASGTFETYTEVYSKWWKDYHPETKPSVTSPSQGGLVIRPVLTLPQKTASEEGQEMYGINVRRGNRGQGSNYTGLSSSSRTVESAGISGVTTNNTQQEGNSQKDLWQELQGIPLGDRALRYMEEYPLDIILQRGGGSAFATFGDGSMRMYLGLDNPNLDALFLHEMIHYVYRRTPGMVPDPQTFWRDEFIEQKMSEETDANVVEIVYRLQWRNKNGAPAGARPKLALERQYQEA